jgi:hypothetical protein
MIIDIWTQASPALRSGTRLQNLLGVEGGKANEHRS